MCGEQLVEGLLPAGAQGCDVDDLAELVDVSVRQIEQRVDVGNAELVTTAAGPYDIVACLHLSFGDHPAVKPRTPLSHKQIGHLRLVETQADPKARDTWLGDLELRATNAVSVTDADILVGKPADGEVLPEIPRSQVVAVEKFGPEVIRLGLVDQHCALFTTVAAEVTLAITVEVEPASHDRSVHRCLQIAVCTVLSRHCTSLGMPTFTETSWPTGVSSWNSHHRYWGEWPRLLHSDNRVNT